jgi:uncharacterized protein YdhG (YjbR/CyaY superfamily)
MSAKKVAKKPARRAAATKKAPTFTAEERAAMQERAREVKALRARKGRASGEQDVLARIGEMQGPDRAMAERLHAIVRAHAPSLTPQTWYGMPAYARDGKVVCFFQSASKFKTRYSSFCFADAATLDDGGMWPVGFALKELTAAEETKIATLLKRAVR